MNIQLSDHFTYGRLIRFTLPSAAMLIFTSIYGVVDGIFVPNFAGKTAFAAVNLIMPYLMLWGTLGFMIGTGGTARGPWCSKLRRSCFCRCCLNWTAFGGPWWWRKSVR